MDQFEYLNKHPYIPMTDHKTLLELTYCTEVYPASSLRLQFPFLCNALQTSYQVKKKKCYLQSHILTTWKFKQMCYALAIYVQRGKMTFHVARVILLMLFQVDIPLVTYEGTHRQNERPCTITTRDLFQSLDRVIFYNKDEEDHELKKTNKRKNITDI